MLEDQCTTPERRNMTLKAYLFINVFLDLVSHWAQTIVAASSSEHHKEMKNKFDLLDLYYK